MKRPTVYGGNPVNRLLWWKVDPDTLGYHLRQYQTAGFLDSARGRAVTCLMVSLGLSLLGALFQPMGVDEIVAFSLIVLLLAFFIYRGHLWANVATMILWTAMKLLQLLVPPFWLHLVPAILWWGLFMNFFYLSYRVEKERKRRRRDGMPDDPDELSQSPEARVF